MCSVLGTGLGTHYPLGRCALYWIVGTHWVDLFWTGCPLGRCALYWVVGTCWVDVFWCGAARNHLSPSASHTLLPAQPVQRQSKDKDKDVLWYGLVMICKQKHVSLNFKFFPWIVPYLEAQADQLFSLHLLWLLLPLQPLLLPLQQEQSSFSA